MSFDRCDPLEELLKEYEDTRQRRSKCPLAGNGWLSFAAAAGASLAASTPASAAITHVVPPSPVRAMLGGYPQYVDLDGAAETQPEDVGIAANFYSGGFTDVHLGGLAGLAYVDRVVGSYGYFNLPFATTLFFVKKYSTGEAIAPSTGVLAGSVLRNSTAQFGSVQNVDGLWGLSDTGFAGFVLDDGSPNRKFGWIKVRTESSAGRLSAVVIDEWAFETTPNTPIDAGATMSAGGDVPGDYDGNGMVGPEDYNEWADAFGDAVAPGTGADGNENGIVDAADYTVFKDNLGAASSATALGSRAIPEPGTVTLGMLALGAAGIFALRRRS